jgi:peptide/nickel transport system substrate-binding protein
VAFGWEVGKNKNVSNPNREPYENITSVVADKANPKKCTINFAKAKYDYFANLPEALPSHLDEEIFNKHKNKAEGYDVNSLYTKNPTNPGLWMGPYILSELKLGSHLVFVPNPHWEGKRPGFKKIIYKLIPNNATFEANLRSGTIDMVSPSAGLSSDQAAALEKKTKAENLPFNVVFQDGYVYGHVDVNLDNPVLSDLKVRKALSMAFNKKDMIDSLLEGKARPANHFVTEKDPWYTDKVEIYNYNKREAMRTLDEAGWKMTPSGIREKNGKRLTFTIYSSAGAKINDMIMAYLQDKWRAIGADLQIKTEAARVFFGQTVSHRKYDLALYSWISIPESSPRSILHSSMIPSEKNAWAGQNSGGWRNKEVDKLVDQLEMELNAKKRADIAHKVIELYTKEIPVIPLYYRGNNAVIPKWLKGYQLSGHLYYETLYAENWTN